MIVSAGGNEYKVCTTTVTVVHASEFRRESQTDRKHSIGAASTSEVLVLAIATRSSAGNSECGSCQQHDCSSRMKRSTCIYVYRAYINLSNHIPRGRGVKGQSKAGTILDHSFRAKVVEFLIHYRCYKMLSSAGIWIIHHRENSSWSTIVLNTSYPA